MDMLQDTALYIRILVPKLNLYISVQKYSPLHAHQTQTAICAEDIAFVQPVSIHSAFANADANARANPTHPLYSHLSNARRPVDSNCQTASTSPTEKEGDGRVLKNYGHSPRGCIQR